MTANQVIEEIKHLAPKEQAKVIDYVKRLPNAETLAAMSESTQALPRFDSVEALFEELES